MKSIYIHLALLMAVNVIHSKCNCESASRSKRGIPFLLFPRTSPTRVQIISGIGIPVSLKHESVTIGWVFKAEYFLPENASNVLDILGDPFMPTTRPLTGFGRRKRSVVANNPNQAIDDYYTRGASQGYDDVQQQKFEKYSVPAMVVESAPNKAAPDVEDGLEDGEEYDEEDMVNQQFSLNDLKIKQPNNLATARFSVYKGMEQMISRNGHEGRPCMLRSICESAVARFTHENGILGELAHIVMTPSTSPDQVRQNSDNEYLHAEELGRSGAPCEKVFRECPVSILDEFSGMYNNVGGLMNFIG